jgi:hypothetical protein
VYLQLECSLAPGAVAELRLVRPMKSLASLITCFCAVATLNCCTSGFYHVQTAIRFRYPSVDLFGTYASQWTVDDVRQIVDLSRNRPDIKKPIDQIEVDRPEHASVKSGNPQNQGDPLTTFEVRKQNGRWIIINGSVNTGPAIITS